MSDEEEAGSDKVTACTRTFEEIDAQVFPGPGRGATLSEAAASDRWGGPSAATVEAYGRMVDLVVNHQRAHSERRANMASGHMPRPTPGSSDGNCAGQTVEEANVVDWRAVPNGTESDISATAERMTRAEERSRGVRSATSCATGRQMYSDVYRNMPTPVR